MSIFRDGQGYWRVRYKDHGGKWKTKSFGKTNASKSKAEAFDRSPQIPQVTMKSVISDLKAELILNGKTERYANDLERVVMKSGLANRPINQLTIKDFSEYNNYGLVTRNRYLSYLKIVMNFALRQELIDRNPLSRWHKPKEPPRRNPLTLQDLETIKRHAVPHLQWAIEVAQNLGVRCGKTELFTLKWQNVNHEHLFIQVFSNKTKNWREVPITKEFARELKERQKEANTEYIVEYNGKQIERIQGSWRSATKAAKIKYHCVFYDVRHLFATTLLNRGADLLSVSALMGHASVKMTADVYGHACAKSMRKAIGLL